MKTEQSKDSKFQKSNIMIMRLKKGKKVKKVLEKEEELNIRVKKGRKEIREFKYLGESFNENGDNLTKIQKIKQITIYDANYHI